MSTTVENNVSTVIEIDGKSVDLSTIPAFQTMIAKINAQAAQQEKSKVQSQIEKLKKGIETLSKVEIKEENPSTFDPATFKTEMLGEVRTLFEQMISPVLQSATNAEAYTIEAYRNKLIQENQDKCIPELVVGKTREELDAALTASIQVFEKYAAKNGNPQTPVTTNATSNPQTTAPVVPTEEPIVIPEVPATPPVNLDVPDIKSMTPAEYAKRREELHSLVSKMV